MDLAVSFSALASRLAATATAAASARYTQLTKITSSTTGTTEAGNYAPFMTFSLQAQILILLVLLGPILHLFDSLRVNRFKNYGTKRYHEFDGLPLGEAALEWFATWFSSFNKMVFGWIATNTHSATILNLISKRIVIAHPSMERALAKRVDDTSLANNAIFFGKAMFNLSDDGIERITTYDPRPIHRQAFLGTDAAQFLIQEASQVARGRLDRQPDVEETKLGTWMFNLMSATITTSIWGSVNPWNLGDDTFLERYHTFTLSLSTLLRPLPQLTARRALKARQDVLAYLKSFHAKHKETRKQQVAHRINIVAMTDPSWDTNPDYFHVELLKAQGLTITPIVVSIWLVRHLLANKPLMQRVVAELRSLDDTALDQDGKLDVQYVRDNCPLFVACLHEAMRLHSTAIPRLARHDLDVPIPKDSSSSSSSLFSLTRKPNVVNIKKDDIILLPMTSFNRVAATWGPDYLAFNPDRFLGKDGNVSEAVVRKLHVFGVAANMCPGRKIGFDLVLFAMASLLREFDFEPAPMTTKGKGKQDFPEPVPSYEPGIGFERVGDDVQVFIKRAAISSARA